MGYEVAGGLGVKLADPDREVLVMVGDGSWLMMSSEIATVVQEGVRLTVVLDRQPWLRLDRRAVAVAGIGRASAPPTSTGRPRRQRRQPGRDRRAGGHGRPSWRRRSRDARDADRTTVIVVECDPARGVGSYESWWDVPVAEVSTMPAVQRARAGYERERERQRPFLGGDEVADGGCGSASSARA